jgi:hypothetical protein
MFMLHWHGSDEEMLVEEMLVHCRRCAGVGSRRSHHDHAITGAAMTVRIWATLRAVTRCFRDLTYAHRAGRDAGVPDGAPPTPRPEAGSGRLVNDLARIALAGRC